MSIDDFYNGKFQFSNLIFDIYFNEPCSSQPYGKEVYWFKKYKPIMFCGLTAIK